MCREGRGPAAPALQANKDMRLLWQWGRAGGVNMATAATNNNTRHTGQAAHTQHTTQISPHFLLPITSLARPGPGPAASRGICFMSTSTIRRETKRALPIGWHLELWRKTTQQQQCRNLQSDIGQQAARVQPDNSTLQYIFLKC